jgi:hypothetical protein
MAAGPYARRLESALSAVAERPVVLSPRDWALVHDWHQRGVPLGLVLETLEEIVEERRRRRTGPPRTLASIRGAVEEAWSVVVHGRRDGDAPPGEAGPPAPGRGAAAWRRVAEAEEPESPLARLLRGCLEALEGGAEPERVDADLDRGLKAAAPEAAARLEEEVSRRLTVHRDRMDPEAFRATVERGVKDGLRAELGLPRLADVDASV